MTENPAELTRSQTSEETFQMRRDFLRHLYFDRYEESSDVGELARALHRASCIAFDTLRYRESHAWPLAVRKKGWKIDVGVLMRVWGEWRARGEV